MEIMSEKILTSINYLVYSCQDLLIIIGLVVGVYFVGSNFRNYSYRRDFAIFIKMTILMFLTSFILEGIAIASVTKLYDRIFYHISGIIILSFFILFIVEKLLFYKRNIKYYSIEQDFIEYLIYLLYFFMTISIGYGIKYFLFAFFWQTVFISLRFYMKKKKQIQKKKYRLYPSREEQLKIIEKIIKESEYKNFAIAISGKWGSGKSLLLEALMARAEEQTNYYIYIKPMITDTRETLINEFQKLLSNIMIKNGIYCGRHSALENYFKEVMGLLNIESKASILNLIKGTEESKSYRDFKNEVQDDIDALLVENNKLVIVIDDFDRIDEKKQLDVLTFIKEVIDFKGCIVLFALDYNNFTNSQRITAEYLEKFIAAKINLVNVEFRELIEFHKDEELIGDNIKSQYIKDILTDIYNNLVVYFDQQYEYFIEEINNNHRYYKLDDDYKQQLMDFNVRLKVCIDNSVRVIHLLKEIKTSLLTLESMYDEETVIQEIFKVSDVAKLVFTMNFIKVFERKIYDEIIEIQGLEAYLHNSDEKVESIDEVYVRILLSQIMLCNCKKDNDNEYNGILKRCISFATKFMKI